MICNKCVSARIAKCIIFLYIKTIYPEQTIKVIFQDSQRNEYENEKTANSNGIIVLTISRDLPETLLNPFNGNLILTLTDLSDQPLILIPEDQSKEILQDIYCAEITVVNENSTSDSATLFYNLIG